jgi:hypothetical protein
MPRYFDFLIHIGERRDHGKCHPTIGEGQDGYYPVEARLGDGAVFEGGRLELDRVALNLSALRQDPEAHGRMLSEAIFSDAIDDAFQTALGEVQHASGYDGLRVRVSIAAEAPELHTLGWELLHHQEEREWRPLATSATSPFSRYVTMKHPHPLPVLAGPVRILVVIAHPSGVPPHALAPIDVAAEIDNFRLALAEIPAGRAVRVTFMPGRSGLAAEQRRILEEAGHTVVNGPTSLEHIAARLRRGYDVLHCLGHGHFDHITNTATLHLEDASGGWDTVADTKFTNMVRGLRDRPRLVFLSACQSATRGGHDAFVGLAPKLVRANVPAVVAMQDQVSMDDARTLTRHFYANLFEHGLVDLALNQARSQLYQPDHFAWGIPVLFTRLTDGCLFTLPDERPRKRRLLVAMPRGAAGRQARGLATGNPLTLLACWLRARVQRAHELLAGTPAGDAFPYLAGKLLAMRQVALLVLVLCMLTGPFVDLNVERWAVPILVFVAGATWRPHRCGPVLLRSGRPTDPLDGLSERSRPGLPRPDLASAGREPLPVACHDRLLARRLEVRFRLDALGAALRAAGNTAWLASDMGVIPSELLARISRIYVLLTGTHERRVIRRGEDVLSLLRARRQKNISDLASADGTQAPVHHVGIAPYLSALHARHLRRAKRASNASAVGDFTRRASSSRSALAVRDDSAAVQIVSPGAGFTSVLQLTAGNRATRADHG